MERIQRPHECLNGLSHAHKHSTYALTHEYRIRYYSHICARGRLARSPDAVIHLHFSTRTAATQHTHRQDVMTNVYINMMKCSCAHLSSPCLCLLLACVRLSYLPDNSIHNMECSRILTASCLVPFCTRTTSNTRPPHLNGARAPSNDIWISGVLLSLSSLPSSPVFRIHCRVESRHSSNPSNMPH